MRTIWYDCHSAAQVPRYVRSLNLDAEDDNIHGISALAQNMLNLNMTTLVGVTYEERSNQAHLTGTFQDGGRCVVSTNINVPESVSNDHSYCVGSNKSDGRAEALRGSS